MKKESTYSFLRQRNIVVLISCRIIWGLTQALFMSYFSLFALAQEGVTPEMLGLIVSIKAVGTVILAPIAGYLADSVGRKKMIFAGTFLHSISYLIYVIATDYRMILVGSLVEGLSIIHFPALQAITQDSLAQSKRGLGLSATTGLQALPSLVSPFIGGILYENYGINIGMRIGFSLAFGVGLLVTFIRVKFLNETISQSVEKAQKKSMISILALSYRNMFSILREYKELRGLVLMSTVDTFFAAIVAPFWVVYATDIIGFSKLEWGIILSLVGGIRVMILLFSGGYADRFGRKKVIMINLLIAPLVNLSYIFCQNFFHVLIFQSFLIAQNSFVLPAATALQADIVPKESRGRAIAALGWQPVVISIGVTTHGFLKFPAYFIGSLLSGYIYAMDHRFPWLLLATAYVSEIIICHFLIKEPVKPAE